MAVLHNRVSQKELKQLLLQETEHRTTISFYHYFPISDPALFRDELYSNLHALKVFGRIYVAHEGINAQISVPESNFEAMKAYLYSIEPLNGIRLNIAVDDDGKSFWVLKVKVREKIVADGIQDPAFDMSNKGKYVNAEDFNRLIEDPDTIVVDMRNHYEFMGKEGQTVPEMTDEWVDIISRRYIELYEQVTGSTFRPESLSNEETFQIVAAALEKYA